MSQCRARDKRRAAKNDSNVTQHSSVHETLPVELHQPVRSRHHRHAGFVPSLKRLFDHFGHRIDAPVPSRRDRSIRISISESELKYATIRLFNFGARPDRHSPFAIPATERQRLRDRENHYPSGQSCGVCHDETIEALRGWNSRNRFGTPRARIVAGREVLPYRCTIKTGRTCRWTLSRWVQDSPPSCAV